MAGRVKRVKKRALTKLKHQQNAALGATLREALGCPEARIYPIQRCLVISFEDASAILARLK
jgi:hypothetical protein